MREEQPDQPGMVSKMPQAPEWIGHGVAHTHLVDGIKRHARSRRICCPAPAQACWLTRAGKDPEHHGEISNSLCGTAVTRPPKNHNQNGEQVKPQAETRSRSEARPCSIPWCTRRGSGRILKIKCSMGLLERVMPHGHCKVARR